MGNITKRSSSSSVDHNKGLEHKTLGEFAVAVKWDLTLWGGSVGSRRAGGGSGEGREAVDSRTCRVQLEGCIPGFFYSLSCWTVHWNTHPFGDSNRFFLLLKLLTSLKGTDLFGFLFLVVIQRYFFLSTLKVCSFQILFKGLCLIFSLQKLSPQW